MQNTNQTIIGVFASRIDADNAISQLGNLGYAASDMSVLVRDQNVTTQTTGVGSNVLEGATTGATTGGVVGALAGLLVGIGAITFPGLGALFIGGPLAAALGITGAAATTVSGAATGVVAGGLVGALVGLGLPQDVAQVYENRIREGAVVLAVPIVDRIDQVKVQQVYENNKADQIRTIRGKGTV